MNESDFSKDTTFGVIGICGANCNLVARILKDRGFDVIGTDMSSGDDCRFKKSLEGYDIEVFYESHPEEFFEKADYIIPPISLPKTAEVFDIIREKNIPVLEVSDIIDIFNRRYRNDRTKIAGLQKYLLEAAQKGDLEAVKMYEIAADELAMIVGSVYRKLKFGEGTLVSYSGGLFHAGEFILGPLREQLKTEGVRLCAPKYTPVEGASLLAAEMFDGEKQYIEAIRRGFDIK